MNDDEKLMKQALLQIQNHADVGVDEWIAVEKALRERLAQPDVDPCKDGSCDCCWTDKPVQEPVAWRKFDGEGGYDYRSYDMNENYAAEWAQRNPRHADWVEPLYTAPPSREWVGLTDEERSEILTNYAYPRNIIKATEAKLKEKNT